MPLARTRNGCTAPPVRVLERRGAVRKEYTRCQGGATKVRAGKEPASQVISANDVMWAFFRSTEPIQSTPTIALHNH